MNTTAAPVIDHSTIKNTLIKEGNQFFKITLPSKDVLTIHKYMPKFYGLKPGTIVEISYGEYCEGSYDGKSREDHHYMASGTSYHAYDDLDAVIEAFLKMTKSESVIKACRLYSGKRLEEILDPEPSEVSGIPHFLSKNGI